MKSEQVNQHCGEYILGNKDNKQEDVSLPKSTLWNFIKVDLMEKGMKADKKVCELFDKMAIQYVSHLSIIGSQVCQKEGKKTLNIEHILEALKQLHFDSYIQKLMSEDCLKDYQSIKENSDKHDNSNIKNVINKFKKKTGKRKKVVQTQEELEALEREQNLLFEQARNELFNTIYQQGQGQQPPQPQDISIPPKDNLNEKEQEELEKNIFDIKRTNEDEVQFD